jgi:RecA/RadA recombinase
MIKFVGDIPSSTERIKTGFYSLDHAVADVSNNIGWPLRSLVEVYGPKGVGKSSFCFMMLGILAKVKNKKIDILDFEIQDRETVENILSCAGYDGEVNYLLTKPKETPEETLERFTALMFTKNPNMGLVDSLGGFVPSSELDGSIGDRNIGDKPLKLGQFTGRLITAMSQAESPSSIFMTNHVHPTIGGMVAGSVTGGGERKKYLSHIRLNLKRAFVGKSTLDFGETWLMQGHVDDNRYGKRRTDFYMFMVGGEGAHLGLTSVFENLVYGYAISSSQSIKETSTVTLDGKSYGKIGYMIEHRDDADLFKDFQNRLLASEVTSSQTEETEEE